MNLDLVADAAVQSLEKASLSVDEPCALSFAYFFQLVSNGLKLVEVIEGNLPIVLSVPHGGLLVPDTIPNRTRGCLVVDAFTSDLAFMMHSALCGHYKSRGGVPHLVLLRLKRIKLDVNRPRADAADDEVATLVWDEYHRALERAVRNAVSAFGYAHVFDIHGQSHRPHTTELGYLVRGLQLECDDVTLSTLAPPDSTSLAALLRRSPHPYASVLRGPTSLGALLEQRGLAAVPSPSQPWPRPYARGPAAGLESGDDLTYQQDNVYFSGGYITRRYSVGGPGVQPLSPDSVSATQLETPGSARLDPDAIGAFARQLAVALVEFMRLHYGLQAGEGAADCGC